MDEEAVAELTFGSHEDLATLAGKVGQALGVTFELRDSLYRGGAYYRAESEGGEFVVQLNEDLDELAVPERPECRAVLYATAPASARATVVGKLTSLGLEMLSDDVSPK